jgi:hypothetical protein
VLALAQDAALTEYFEARGTAEEIETLSARLDEALGSEDSG